MFAAPRFPEESALFFDREQLFDAYPEGLSELADRPDGEVLGASLNTSQVAGRKVQPLGELLLSQPPSSPHRGDSLPQIEEKGGGRAVRHGFGLKDLFRP